MRQRFAIAEWLAWFRALRALKDFAP